MVKKQKNDTGLAVGGLILNLFIPGLGTLINGNKEQKGAGVGQFVVGLIGLFLTFTLIGAIIGIPMMFGGGVAPVAYVEIKSIGLSEDKCSEFSEALCNFVELELGVAADRIYIDFCNINKKMFGWNRGTF